MARGTRWTVLALSLAGCSSFEGLEGLAAQEDGGSSSTGGPVESTAASQDPAPSTASDGASGASTNSTGPSATSDPTTSGPPDSTTGPDSGAETAMDDASGDTTTASTTGSESGDDGTVSDECVDDDTEPNDVYEDPQPLGTQACLAAASTTMGTLSDASDVDHFEFTSPWNANECGIGEPDHLYTVDGPVQLCANFECEFGTGSFSCDVGDWDEFGGYNWCCGTTSVETGIFCPTTNEGTTGHVVVRPDAEAPVCADYSFTYQVLFD